MRQKAVDKNFAIVPEALFGRLLKLLKNFLCYSRYLRFISNMVCPHLLRPFVLQVQRHCDEKKQQEKK
ncbi:hypothetical protein DPMN_087429 [Dreissena polymorpha]|uniref:Uncharacterized protein n=1 Tax=Dreissena polymorpha TaxID=45954 RepID=A0A9D4KU74_DREPO|nr:hypothetical protein DPMN_087429 [Dreissena polymorpha]